VSVSVPEPFLFGTIVQTEMASLEEVKVLFFALVRGSPPPGLKVYS
jgi:hypothetical protein